MVKILFVCHGNICRSTMAEFVMKHLVAEENLSDKIFVASAACHSDELGSDTHHGTKAKLKEMGIPFTKRKAVLLTKQDYADYDFIIGMDGENMRDIPRITGGDPDGKIFMLLEFAGERRSIADPWYSGNFDATYDDVLKGCTALLQKIKKTLPE